MLDSAGSAVEPVAISIPQGPRPVAGTVAVTTLRRALTGAQVAHAHGLRAGLLTLLAGARGPIPLAVSWHNAPLGGPMQRLEAAAVERIVARGAAMTLAASADLASRARAAGGRDVRLAPVAAPALRAPTRSAMQVRAELGAGARPVLLAVGRLHPQKDYPTLLAAADRLTVRRPAPLVVVAGEGPQRATLQRRITASGAPVRLLGARSDVADLLAAADVVVLPSRWEARSLVAQEALRAGVPLIATRVGGIPELVGDAAVLVPPGDPAALADAAGALLDDPSRRARLADRGRTQAAGWPDEHEVVAAAAASYRELIRQTP